MLRIRPLPPFSWDGLSPSAVSPLVGADVKPQSYYYYYYFFFVVVVVVFFVFFFFSSFEPATFCVAECANRCATYPGREEEDEDVDEEGGGGGRGRGEEKDEEEPYDVTPLLRVVDDMMMMMIRRRR